MEFEKFIIMPRFVTAVQFHVIEGGMWNSVLKTVIIECEGYTIDKGNKNVGVKKLFTRWIFLHKKKWVSMVLHHREKQLWRCGLTAAKLTLRRNFSSQVWVIV